MTRFCLILFLCAACSTVAKPPVQPGAADGAASPVDADGIASVVDAALPAGDDAAIAADAPADLPLVPPLDAAAEKKPKPVPTPVPTPDATPGAFHGTIVLGAPAATSIKANLLSPDQNGTVHLAYGKVAGAYDRQTAPAPLSAGVPLEIGMDGLAADTEYFYRLHFQATGATGDVPSDEYSFHTARAPGSTFSFSIQGDSHPERVGKMFSPDLYRLNMQNVAARQPDFHLGIGDDFSIDPLIDKNQLTEAGVNQVYMNQHNYFGVMGNSVPVFLVNGNHEQAAGYLLTAAYPTPYANAPIFAGKARTSYFSLPAPDSFYTGDTEEVPGVGLLRDYYAWQWGDALFVTIDPYWHSPTPVDQGVPGVTPPADAWLKTIGDAQYAWLKKTLEASKAKYKFVFEHHVLGTGRGGAALAGLYEWGGYGKSGANEFAARRPTWAKPVHQLMNDNKVTIFFFGHDHLFAREKVDGVVYQSLPNPADNTYTAFNADAYAPASIPYPGAVYDPAYGVTLPNAGHVNVTVSSANVTVAYVRAVLPGDEIKAGCANGDVALTYSVPAR